MDALQIVSVANTAVKLSPTGKSNTGMLAGMLEGAVIVGRAVGVPVAIAEVHNPLSPPILLVSSRATALSDRRKVVKVCHKRRGIY